MDSLRRFGLNLTTHLEAASKKIYFLSECDIILKKFKKHNFGLSHCDLLAPFTSLDFSKKNDFWICPWIESFLMLQPKLQFDTSLHKMIIDFSALLITKYHQNVKTSRLYNFDYIFTIFRILGTVLLHPMM